MRVYALAKQLDVESKILLDYCKELGFDIKNQLSSLDPEQADAVIERVKRGSKVAAPAPAAPASPAVLPTNISTKVQTLPSRKTAAPKAGESAPPAPDAEAPLPPPAAAVPAPAPAPVVPAPAAASAPPVIAAAPPKPAAAPVVPPARPTVTAPTPAPPPPPAAPRPAPPAPKPVAPPTVAAQAPPPSTGSKLPPRPTPLPPRSAAGPVRTLGGGPRPDAGGGGGGSSPTRAGPRLVLRPRPVGGQNFTARPNQTTLRQSQPGAAPAAPDKKEIGGVKKLAAIPQDLLHKGRNVTAEQVMQAHRAETAPVGPDVAPPDVGDDEDAKGKDGKKKPGSVGGRDIRRVGRDARAKERKGDNVQVQGGRVVSVDDDRPLRVRDRLKQRGKIRQPGTVARKGNVIIDLPITVRTLSTAVGLTVPKLLQKLMALGMPFGTVNINTILDPDVAQLIATEQGCELEIRKAEDAEDKLLARQSEVDDPDKLKPRPPVVTIMGHVDHGKTSLLDKIRKSNVAAGEVGGITQVIRAWQVEHAGELITFLDTPGHEAFTKMRARGAQVTDIAVIVAAADDGVMPQTEEAINHAKAAGVSLIVCINKIDLPNANIPKTRQQLYSLGVLPDDMGGDVPFVETSAAKGTGIDALLEAIQVVAELKELKANPDKPGRGTVLEAHLSGDAGVHATLLVQDGTLRRGDVVVCGPAYGRVRAMYNDLGKSIDEAGPGTPVRITGLDDVPNADDPFSVVDDITTAREIAEKRSGKLQEAALTKFVPATLEKLGESKVAELKVILKADFRGSVEAIRKELEKLRHDEVRVRVLHAGIGGITVSDVQLAMTSPTDTMIVGFNAVPDDEAKALAEQLGVSIREYSIIYNLTDDIKAALEGKLKPREEIVYLGRAVVREVFKISKVGTIAGCHVTQGVIERSAKVRLIRGGVVVYPPADRTAGLESLKHHKDDVREIKAGYDCGIKIANYDDVKVDDVIEAFRIDEIKRTL